MNIWGRKECVCGEGGGWIEVSFIGKCKSLITMYKKLRTTHTSLIISVGGIRSHLSV